MNLLFIGPQIRQKFTQHTEIFSKLHIIQTLYITQTVIFDFGNFSSWYRYAKTFNVILAGHSLIQLFALLLLLMCGGVIPSIFPHIYKSLSRDEETPYTLIHLSSCRLDPVSSLLSHERRQWKSISDLIFVCTTDCSHVEELCLDFVFLNSLFLL